MLFDCLVCKASIMVLTLAALSMETGANSIRKTEKRSTLCTMDAVYNACIDLYDEYIDARWQLSKDRAGNLDIAGSPQASVNHLCRVQLTYEQCKRNYITKRCAQDSAFTARFKAAADQYAAGNKQYFAQLGSFGTACTTLVQSFQGSKSN